MGVIVFEKLLLLIYDGLHLWRDSFEFFTRCVFKINLWKPFEISFGKKSQSRYSNMEKSAVDFFRKDVISILIY